MLQCITYLDGLIVHKKIRKEMTKPFNTFLSETLKYMPKAYKRIRRDSSEKRRLLSHPLDENNSHD